MKSKEPETNLDLFAQAKIKKEKELRKERQEKIVDKLIGAAITIATGVVTALLVKWISG